MREMVLNHASVQAPDKDTAIRWLVDMTVGLSVLVRDGVATSALRESRSFSDIYPLPDWPLFSAFLELKQRGNHDEFRFLAGLSTRVPLLRGTDLEVANRFLGCEHARMSREDGDPLVYCAITDGIAVGFPSGPDWDRHQVTVTFEELLPNGEFNEVWEIIDNLTRSEYAPVISARHRGQIRNGLLQSVNGATLWEKRQQAFPHLLFGPDVESHLAMLNPGELGTVANKLASLDDAADEWSVARGPVPPWRSKVTDENSTVKTTPNLRDARQFRSSDGIPRLFMWHARFGGSGRIHLRFDGDSNKVEIGYIGHHLPMPI